MKYVIMCLAALLTVSAAGSAFAAGAAVPDPMTNGALASIIKEGGKVFYLGNDHGLNGWFAVENGLVQILYQTPDNKGVVAGSMFGPDNDKITPTQVAKLLKDNKEVADMVEAAKKANEAPAATSLGERLTHDLTSASTVVVGKASSPELLMVMDTINPHVQATWKALRDRVIKGDLHIRMIPVGDPGSDNERAAAIFLASADPLAVWDKYVVGDHGQLTGAPSEDALKHIRANHVVIDNWNVPLTPYLVYRGKDGKVKILQGEPENAPALLADMGL
jgi:hypothetical protein